MGELDGRPGRPRPTPSGPASFSKNCAGDAEEEEEQQETGPARCCNPTMRSSRASTMPTAQPATDRARSAETPYERLVEQLRLHDASRLLGLGGNDTIARDPLREGRGGRRAHDGEGKPSARGVRVPVLSNRGRPGRRSAHAAVGRRVPGRDGDGVHRLLLVAQERRPRAGDPERPLREHLRHPGRRPGGGPGGGQADRRWRSRRRTAATAPRSASTTSRTAIRRSGTTTCTSSRATRTTGCTAAESGTRRPRSGSRMRRSYGRCSRLTRDGAGVLSSPRSGDDGE